MIWQPKRCWKKESGPKVAGKEVVRGLGSQGDQGCRGGGGGGLWGNRREKLDVTVLTVAFRGEETLADLFNRMKAVCSSLLFISTLNPHPNNIFTAQKPLRTIYTSNLGNELFNFTRKLKSEGNFPRDIPCSVHTYCGKITFLHFTLYGLSQLSFNSFPGNAL